MSYLFTSESVTEGHPDKLCDQISDAILDEALRQDPLSHVACECLATTGLVVVAGEMRTKGYVDMKAVARKTVREIGYDDATYGFDEKACAVIVCVGEQSGDIAIGVDADAAVQKEQGAGDQGLMFGYASDETPELMPMPILYAHKLTRRLAEARKKKEMTFLRPDGKSQVTIQYEGTQPVRIDTVVISTQHSPDVKYETIKEAVIDGVIRKALPKELLDAKTRFLVNPTGRFVVGGPHGDCGLTGRKIIVDTYGGKGRHGGGAFSGKDPSKVDRSACYMARYVAKNVVAAGLADACEIQIAYAIGYPEPVSFMVDSFGTGKVPDERLTAAVQKVFSLKPSKIIETLDLLRPIYKKTAAYGHFGRNEPEFTWEKTDRAQDLRKAV